MHRVVVVAIPDVILFDLAIPVEVFGRAVERHRYAFEVCAERPGAVLSRSQLEERLYGWGEEIESNAVEVYIHGLRRKLGAEFIRTVRGVGYRVSKSP